MSYSIYFHPFKNKKYKELIKDYKDDLFSDKEVIDFAKEYIKSQLVNNDLRKEIVVCSYDLDINYPYNEHLIGEFKFGTKGVQYTGVNNIIKNLYDSLKENIPNDYSFKSIYWFINKCSINEPVGDIVLFLDNLIFDTDGNLIKNKEYIRMSIDYTLGHERYHYICEKNKEKKLLDILKFIPSQWIKNELKDSKLTNIYDFKINDKNFKLNSIIKSFYKKLHEQLADKAGIIHMVKKIRERNKEEN